MSKIIRSDYVDFIVGDALPFEELPPELVPEKTIMVFSHKIGKKIYKKKNRCVGVIVKSNEYIFVPTTDTSYSGETLLHICSFIKSLICNRIIFKGGELKRC